MAERKPGGREEHRPVRRAPDDYDGPTGDQDAEQDYLGQDDLEQEDAEYDGGAGGAESADAQPDVLLHVPVLKVEEINLEVDNLDAHVRLQADVLDLLKLHVGADVSIGRVSLGIKGVDVVAVLKVRLGKVAEITGQVMTMIGDNPQILTDLTRGLGEAAREVGRGAGGALQEVGRGAGGALEEVGRGAGGALQEVGRGAGGALEEVGQGAGGALQEVGQGAGEVLGEVGEGVEQAVGGLGEDVDRAAGDVIEDADDTVEEVRPGRGGAGSGREAGQTDRRPERPPSPSGERPRRARRQEPPARAGSPRREPEPRPRRRTRLE